MEYKRKSGEVVELKQLKTSQRLHSQDAISYEYVGNSMTIHGLPRAKYLAAMAALGLSSVDDFDDLDYTHEEILAIGALATVEDKKAADPTSKG